MYLAPHTGFDFDFRLRLGPFEGPAIVMPPAMPGDTYFCSLLILWLSGTIFQFQGDDEMTELSEDRRRQYDELKREKRRIAKACPLYGLLMFQLLLALTQLLEPKARDFGFLLLGISFPLLSIWATWMGAKFLGWNQLNHSLSASNDSLHMLFTG